MSEASEKKVGKAFSKLFEGSVDEILREIENNSAELDDNIYNIPIKNIKTNPYQPRKHFDERKLQELADSISTHGVFTPILVREKENEYELIAGERRLRASKMANKDTIPAIVVELDDKEMMEIALLENIQREDLNVIEEAQGYQKILDSLNMTQEQLAKRVGKSREHITNTLRLLKLPESIQNMVIEDKLSMGHVRALLSLSDEKDMISLAEKAIAEKMNVRQVEAEVKKLGHSQDKKMKKDNLIDADIDTLRKELQHQLKTKVKVDEKHITISCQGVDDLKRIMKELTKK